MATGIAFYSIDEKGERHYVFYRFPGYSEPEATLKAGDIKPEHIAQSKVLHFSEAPLRNSKTREAIFEIVRGAKDEGVRISYDPNVREPLWTSREEFLEAQRRALGLTDIFSSTLNEARLIAGGRTAKETLNTIMASGPSTVVIREKEKYEAATANENFTVPIFRVKAVDTSGAGDAFDAGLLTGLAKGWRLKRAVLLGAAVAALKVMKVGTRTGLPRMEEALSFIKEKGAS